MSAASIVFVAWLAGAVGMAAWCTFWYIRKGRRAAYQGYAAEVGLERVSPWLVFAVASVLWFLMVVLLIVLPRTHQ